MPLEPEVITLVLVYTLRKLMRAKFMWYVIYAMDREDSLEARKARQRDLGNSGPVVSAKPFLETQDMPESPGNLGFPGTTRVTRKNRETGWWCRQSGANPSPRISLLNRENTGNFSQFSRIFGEPLRYLTVIAW